MSYTTDKFYCKYSYCCMSYKRVANKKGVHFSRVFQEFFIINSRDFPWFFGHVYCYHYVFLSANDSSVFKRFNLWFTIDGSPQIL